MAQRFHRSSSISDYTPLRINTNAATATAIGGSPVVTTTATTITAGQDKTVTPASMTNIAVGVLLNISGGTGTPEWVRVKSIGYAGGVPTTFTADFVNAHSGTNNLISKGGTFLGPLIVGAAGTSAVLTLYNGNPNAKNADNSAFGVILQQVTLAAGTPYHFACAVDNGLWYTLSSSVAPEILVQYVDMPS